MEEPKKPEGLTSYQVSLLFFVIAVLLAQIPRPFSDEAGAWAGFGFVLSFIYFVKGLASHAKHLIYSGSSRESKISNNTNIVESIENANRKAWNTRASSKILFRDYSSTGVSISYESFDSGIDTNHPEYYNLRKILNEFKTVGHFTFFMIVFLAYSDNSLRDSESKVINKITANLAENSNMSTSSLNNLRRKSKKLYDLLVKIGGYDFAFNIFKHFVIGTVDKLSHLQLVDLFNCLLLVAKSDGMIDHRENAALAFAKSVWLI